jgi:hypothetical protein
MSQMAASMSPQGSCSRSASVSTGGAALNCLIFSIASPPFYGWHTQLVVIPMAHGRHQPQSRSHSSSASCSRSASNERRSASARSSGRGGGGSSDGEGRLRAPYLAASIACPWADAHFGSTASPASAPSAARGADWSWSIRWVQVENTYSRGAPSLWEGTVTQGGGVRAGSGWRSSQRRR